MERQQQKKKTKLKFPAGSISLILPLFGAFLLFGHFFPMESRGTRLRANTGVYEPK